MYISRWCHFGTDICFGFVRIFVFPLQNIKQMLLPHNSFVALYIIWSTVNSKSIETNRFRNLIAATLPCVVYLRADLLRMVPYYVAFSCFYFTFFAQKAGKIYFCFIRLKMGIYSVYIETVYFMFYLTTFVTCLLTHKFELVQRQIYYFFGFKNENRIYNQLIKLKQIILCLTNSKDQMLNINFSV